MLPVSEYLHIKYPNAVKQNESFRSFTNSREEFESLRHGVALRINLATTLIQLTGVDVLDFLHRISTNALKDLKTFEKRNTIFLNEKGKFIDRTTLVYLENDFFLIGSSSENRRLYSWINKFIIAEDIRTKDVSANYSLIDFIGPQAESFLTLLIGKEINSFDASKVRRFDADGFTFHLFMNLENNGIKVYKALIDSEKSSAFIDYLFSISSVFDLRIAGEDAFDAFRIENGIPVFPNEINDETNPHEVNLIQEVCFKKGCYIGQEVIARLDTYDKIQKKLFIVTLSKPVLSGDSIPIFDADKNETGKITTISKDDLMLEQKGLALIRKKNFGNGSMIVSNSDKNEISLKISELPSRT